MVEAISDEGILNSSSAYAETKILPSINVSERYDSNVLFSPSEFTPEGLQRWDFVTSVAPTVEIISKTRGLDAQIRAGANGSVFVNNTDLNFISTYLSGTINLDKWIGQFIRGAKLEVSDNFQFTPEQPNFANVGTPGTTDVFARGIQTIRANILTNTATVKGEYAVSRRFDLRAQYGHSILRVDDIPVAQQAGELPIAFFNVTTHTWSAGPRVRLTRGDSVAVNFKNTQIDLSGVGGLVFRESFTARGLEAEYLKVTPNWTLTTSGGATVLEQGDLAFISGKVALSRTLGTSTGIQIQVSRDIMPVFFATGSALISTAGSLSISHQFSKVLSLTGLLNYAYNEAVPVKIATFESYRASVQLTYNVTRTIATSLAYDYSRFNAEFPSSQGFLINRQFVLFSITAKWN